MLISLRDLLQRKTLPGLDGMRAIAVLIVVTYHAGWPFPAGLGVSAFFVISGFLITWLLLKEVDRSRSIDLRSFYLRRALRIFPAYYAFILVSLVADYLSGDRRSLDAAVPALLYVQNYYNALHDHPSISIAHAWSLSIEEQFYLLWPFLLTFLIRLPVRVIAAAISLFILLVVAWRIFVFFYTDLGTSWIYNAFDTRADSLAVGCLLAVSLNLQRAHQILERVTKSRLAPFAVLLTLVVWRYFQSAELRYTVGLTVEPILLSVLILQLMRVSTDSGWSFLNWKPIAYIGRLSYGMYLYHVLALAVTSKLLRHLNALNQAWYLILGVCMTIALAAASYHWYEKYFLRLKGRLPQRVRTEIAKAYV